MRTIPTALTLSIAIHSLGQQRDPDPVRTNQPPTINYSIVERGAHHRVWQSVSWQTNALGRGMATTNSYTELETGMHRRGGDGQWVEATPEIAIQPDGGALATNVPHRLYLPGDLFNDALQCTTADEKILTTRPIGLSYFDGSTNVLIAELRDGPVGQLLPSGNQVVYTNICTNCRLDLLVTCKKSGYESDLIIREQLPDPRELGFSDASAVRIQWWTEFIDPIHPAKRERILADGSVDHFLDFGETKMGRGKAYLTGAPGDLPSKVDVTKQWVEVDGRTFLVEEIPLVRITRQLGSLPRRTALAHIPTPNVASANSNRQLILHPRGSKPLLPAKRVPQRAAAPISVVAASEANQPGFVVDYDLYSDQTNFTFCADTTYYVTNTVILAGTTTVEGGTVVKFRNGYLVLNNFPNDTIVFNSSPFRAAIFTVKDDDSVGTPIAGSSGNPSITEGTLISNGGVDVHDARFSFIRNPFDLTAGNLEMYFMNVQFINCSYPFVFAWTDAYFRNVLFYKTGTNFYGIGTTISCENVTIHSCSKLGQDDLEGGANNTINFTNSLLVGVTNMAPGWTVVTNNCAEQADNGVAFQTVGAGAHYLANNSPYRNLGTANINSDLLKDLRKKTTYPPIVLYSQIVTNDLTLFPQAQRDTDQLDLGYHYDPLDYAVGHIYLRDATWTVLPGTAVGLFANAAGYYGLVVAGGSKFFCEGAPANVNRVVRCCLVQEQANTNWSVIGPSIVGPSDDGTIAQIMFRFTDWFMPAQDSYHYRGYDDTVSISFADCQFHGGKLWWYGHDVYLTNCVFDRVSTVVDDDYVGLDLNLFVRNCLFFGGSLNLSHYWGGTFFFRDNLFDGTSIPSGSTVDSDYIGYTTTTNHLSPGGAHDLVTNATYQVGPLGNYYLPTNSNFINKGSVTNAASLGFYHYTTTTNQLKELTSRLDIGFHYVAVNSGLPIDSDSDSLPDYAEDSNGDGTYNFGDLGNWNLADTDGDGVSDFLEYLQGRNPRITGITTDTNGTINLRVYTPFH